MIGSTLRWLVATVVPPTPFPWAVLIVNVAGCAILGALLAIEWDHSRARLWLHDFGGIGLCGGLTTMSTFATGVVGLAENGNAWTAGVYVFSSVALGFLGMVVAARSVNRLRALALPLEEEP